MARPRKVKPITSAEVLEFIESSSPDILELIARLIEKKLAQPTEVK